MNEQTWWYISRASGLVAWVLLVGSLIWGVLLATRALKPVDRPAWLLAMHRWLSGLAVTATAVHLLALVLDGYVHFGAAELFVPFASSWQPGAVAVGIAGFYLLVIVQVTSLMMKKLPKRFWRFVHYTSYALVWTVTVHAGMAGTDATNRVYQAVALLLTIAAVSATVLRLLVGRRGAATAAATRPTATAAAATAATPTTAATTPTTRPTGTRERIPAAVRAAAAARATAVDAAGTTTATSGAALAPPTYVPSTALRPPRA